MERCSSAAGRRRPADGGGSPPSWGTCAVLGRVVELQRLAERQTALPDLQPETGGARFAGAPVPRSLGEVRLGLVVRVAQLAPQPGVHLDQLVGERGDRGSHRVGVGSSSTTTGSIRSVASWYSAYPGASATTRAKSSSRRAPSAGTASDSRLLVPQFDPHGGVGEEVAIPVGVDRCAEVGGDDEEPAAVADMAERGGVRLSGAGAGGGEQEEVGALEGAADLPRVGTEFGDDGLLEGLGHGGSGSPGRNAGG